MSLAREMTDDVCQPDKHGLKVVEANMNNAALKGIAMTWADYQNAAAHGASRCTITRTAEGWEARRGGKLLGVCQTREGAKELLGAL